MYNKNYFPTPKAVIELMLDPYKESIKDMNILEPSAGMGAILDHLTFNCRVPKTRLWACEYDQNLKASLIGKGYKVVQDDFLSYSGALNFDLIVMNPPFDNGEKHLLHAWRIMRTGEIVCLLNEETLKNTYTTDRQILAGIIAEHGTVEYIGDAFSTADRKTNVRVAMVRLSAKAEDSTISFSGKKSEKVSAIDLDNVQSGIEQRDYISALTRSYGKAIESTQALYRAITDFNLYTSAFCSQYESPELLAAFFETARKSGFSDAHNEFATSFQRIAWNTIFNNTKASGLMTQKVRAKFDKWRESMGGIDLNHENIVMLFDALIQQRKVIADECIVDAFDRITSYAERKAAGEKWKTNSLYMVPEKFILPNIVEKGWSGGISVCYRSVDMLSDIDRAFCLVSGKSFENISQTYRAISDWCSNHWKEEESEFFEFKCHLKGTVHFKVKDEQLLAEFNRRACSAKGLVLPDEEIFRGKARRDQKVK